MGMLAQICPGKEACQAGFLLAARQEGALTTSLGPNLQCDAHCGTMQLPSCAAFTSVKLKEPFYEPLREQSLCRTLNPKTYKAVDPFENPFLEVHA